MAKPLASVSLITEHGAGSSESLHHVELTGAVEPDDWGTEADKLELGPCIGTGSCSLAVAENAMSAAGWVGQTPSISLPDTRARRRQQ